MSKRDLFTRAGAVLAVVVVAGAIAAKYGCSGAIAVCTQLGVREAAPVVEAVSEQLGVRYQTYSSQALATAQQQGTAVLYFYAPWCTTCSSLDKELQQPQETLPSDVTVLRVPYDSATEMKKKYGVVAQHTLVILNADGTAQKTWVGGDLAHLQQQLGY